MYKVLHTADWHIGKMLAGYSRTDEFNFFFENLHKCIDEQKIDLLLVCGDIFDTATPSNATAKMYYNLIVSLHHRFPELQIIITSGNHDSPSFLSAPSNLLEFFSAKVVANVPKVDGKIDWSSMIIPVKKDNELKAVVCAVPYLRNGELAELGENNRVQKFYAKIYEYANEFRGDANVPIIGMGHLTTFNAEYNDTIVVGGEDNIDTDTLPTGYSYIALGHIHKAQHCGNRENVRYSGSPFQMSFNERNYNNSMCIIEFDNSQLMSIVKYPLPHNVELKVLPQNPSTMYEVQQALQQINDDENLFLSINLNLHERTPENRYKIISEFLSGKRAKFCNWHNAKSTVNSENSAYVPQTAQEFKQRDALEVICEIYKNNNNAEMPDDMKKLLEEVVSSIGFRDVLKIN